ncbi:MAG: alcohol dehydrogenase catalytic domain-containing protein [Kiritimatiellae bacterium]|nr:alcohol dehydrogenase catalytic domain-containing protein [Kiritimatiellia bacterium]
MPRLVSAGDVLLRVAYVGVCGSDVHYYCSGRIGSQVVRYPFRLGHEMSAVVEAVGSGVTRVKPGDRVAVDPAMACGQCDQCLSGRRHTCRHLRFLGCPGQADGCLAEFIVMPEECCFKLPSHMSLAVAAFAEPLSIGVYAVKLASLPKDAAVAVLGTGPIGVSVILAARWHGYGRIYATDKISARLKAATCAGASWTGQPQQEDVVRRIFRREPLLLDAVFECCGQQEALDQAVTLLKPGGTLLVVGIPATERVSFDIETLRRKEVRIQNVRRQNRCMATAIRMLQRVDVGFLLTHEFVLEDASSAFETVANYADGVMKALIRVTLL